MKSEITNRGAGAGNVQRIGAIAAGGVEIGECCVSNNSGGAGNISAVGSVIIVECKIADGGAGSRNVTKTASITTGDIEIGECSIPDDGGGAVNIHLGLQGNGSSEHRSGEDEFGQSFHIFDIVVFVVLVSGHRTAFTHFIAIGSAVLTTF